MKNDDTWEEQMVQARKAHVLAGDPSRLLRVVATPDIPMEQATSSRGLTWEGIGL